MARYIRLIITINLSLCYVEDGEIRRLSKYDFTFSKRIVKEILLHLSALVEKRIAPEIEQ